MNKLIALTVMTAVPVSSFAMPLARPPASAEVQSPTAAAAPSQTPTKTIALPANTEVVLRLADELTSKGNQNKVGSMFRLTVAYDVKVGGITVIPSGTPATGEVTYRTGKGMFGKSGKLEVELRQIDLDGQRIPINGKYRQEGEGNTTAAVGAVFLAAGLMFVTGKSAIIPRGRELSAYTSQTTTIERKPAI